MNLEQLRQFLIDANQAGYVTGEEKQWIKESDGSTTIPYKKGEFSSHDNFFGGEPYGGRLVVSHAGKAIWIMVYYGWVASGIEPTMVYPILRNALKKMPPEAPFRGPATYTEGDFLYTNDWTGTIERYEGIEKITQNNKLIYQANYRGGLVDQRRGV